MAFSRARGCAMFGTMTGHAQNDAEALAALLQWQVEMGADEAVLDAPVDRLASATAHAETKAKAASAPASRPSESSAAGAAPPSPPAPRETDSASGEDRRTPDAPRPDRCETLDEIHRALDSLRQFPLRQTAMHTVHTDGHPQARVLLVGEAPGREEDRLGRPFVGRSGQLLDLMLKAIGLSRTAEDPARAVLITNVVFWRPPGNRKPSEAEVTFCMPWLIRTIEIVRPEVIVCLGATPTQRLTGRAQGILKLRGTWLESEVGARRVPLLPTLHPAYLLRQPLQKRLAWRDLLALKLKLIELGLLPADAGM